MGTIALTAQEKLKLWRRRMSFTRAEAANYFRLKKRVYFAIEHGKKWPGGNILAQIESLTPTEAEMCIISRWRHNLKQRDVAAILKVQHQQVNRMETGKAQCERLSKFWRGIELFDYFNRT